MKFLGSQKSTGWLISFFAYARPCYRTLSTIICYSSHGDGDAICIDANFAEQSCPHWRVFAAPVGIWDLRPPSAMPLIILHRRAICQPCTHRTPGGAYMTARQVKASSRRLSAHLTRRSSARLIIPLYSGKVALYRKATRLHLILTRLPWPFPQRRTRRRNAGVPLCWASPYRWWGTSVLRASHRVLRQWFRALRRGQAFLPSRVRLPCQGPLPCRVLPLCQVFIRRQAPLCPLRPPPMRPTPWGRRFIHGIRSPLIPRIQCTRSMVRTTSRTLTHILIRTQSRTPHISCLYSRAAG